MKELTQIYKDAGQQLIEDLFKDYLVVSEKLSGSSFSFKKDGEGITFYKGGNQKPINLIDRTIMVYYEKPINFIKSVTSKNLSSIPENWKFCFQYFVNTNPGIITYDRLPKNNLVLTHIKVMTPAGKVTKVIEDPRVIRDWANALGVTPLLPLFKGYLTEDQKKKIKEFLETPKEDHAEIFSTNSFAEYLLRILNPNIQSTTLQNDLKKPIESIVFKFYKSGTKQVIAAKLIDPYTINLMKEKEPIDMRKAPADINEIILLDLLAFIEERGIKKHEILGDGEDMRYIELVSNIFNDYVTKRGKDIAKIDIEKAEFAKGKEFDLNVELIPSQRTKDILNSNSKLKDLFKIILGSLKKKRKNAGNIMTPSVIEDFNKMVDKVTDVIQTKDDGKFKTFDDYLKIKSTNESLLPNAEELLIEDKVLDYNNFINLGKVIVEDSRKSGEIWKTSTGFRGQDANGDRKTFKSKEQTQSWIKTGREDVNKEPTDKEPKENKTGVFATKPDGTPIDLNSEKEIQEHAPAQLTKAIGEIDKLLDQDPPDKEGARKLAKQLVTDLEISKPLYLQDGKEGMAKIYIGPKTKKAYNSKSATKGQGAMVSAIEKALAPETIPINKGGISRIFASPQSMHSKRTKAKVEDVKDKDGRVSGKKMSFPGPPEVTRTIKGNPDDPISMLKMQSIPTDDVEFIDLGDVSTPKGRTKAVNQAADNAISTFTTMENNPEVMNHLDEDNKKVLNDVKKGFENLKVLENKKAKLMEEDPIDKEKVKELQKEFNKEAVKILATTKDKNPPKYNEFTNMTAYITETVETMISLNEGNETFVPSSANWKTSDVMVLKPGGEVDNTIVTLKGSSVKFDGGGASSMINKNELSTFKDKEMKNKIKGLTDTYNNLFGPDAKPVSIEDEKRETKKMVNLLEDAYPEFKTKGGKEYLEEEKKKMDNAIRNQMKKYGIKEDDKLTPEQEEEFRKMKVYHLSQFTASMLHNHPEKGIDQQAFSNSDYEERTSKGKKVITRKHSTGTVDDEGNQSVMFSGPAYNKGYTKNKKTGKLKPTNTYSTDMKHSNPALKMLEEIKKKN